jgi:cation diffusion facilitator family transporter
VSDVRARFGNSELSDEQSAALRKAVRVERTTIVTQICVVVLVASVAGQSQAMRVAFIEDALSLLPPLAFLIAVRRTRRRPDPKHPYGHHRAVGAAHLVASVALLVMGLFLVIDSGSGLVTGERPPLGVTHVAGVTVWSGWLMIAVMVITAIPPSVLGRMKQKLADPLHDKVLAADADMNRADWVTAVATIAGVMGIGLGLWWADAVAALVVSVGIIKDGLTNLRQVIDDLLDASATRIGSKEPEPVIATLEECAAVTPWVERAAVRVRDQGHVFHSEIFVVPRRGENPTVHQLEELRGRCIDADWRTQDTVVVPVEQIPDGLAPVD